MQTYIQLKALVGLFGWGCYENLLFSLGCKAIQKDCCQTEILSVCLVDLVPVFLTL